MIEFLIQAAHATALISAIVAMVVATIGFTSVVISPVSQFLKGYK